MREPEPFRVGETVRLRSGGPLMTVTQIMHFDWQGEDFVDPMIPCWWFNEIGELQGDRFHKDTIESVVRQEALTD